MTPSLWKLAAAIGLGSSGGMLVRRSLTAVFGSTSTAVSAATLMTSSMLGGFLGISVGWISGSGSIGPEEQNVLTVGLLAGLATIVASAQALRTSLSAEEATRLRRQTLMHIGVGMLSALVGLALLRWLFRPAG